MSTEGRILLDGPQYLLQHQQFKSLMLEVLWHGWQVADIPEFQDIWPNDVDGDLRVKDCATGSFLAEMVNMHCPGRGNKAINSWSHPTVHWCSSRDWNGSGYVPNCSSMLCWLQMWRQETKTKWMWKWQTKTKVIREVVTISHEVFVLLVLEDIWDVWIKWIFWNSQSAQLQTQTQKKQRSGGGCGGLVIEKTLSMSAEEVEIWEEWFNLTSFL